MHKPLQTNPMTPLTNFTKSLAFDIITYYTLTKKTRRSIPMNAHLQKLMKIGTSPHPDHTYFLRKVMMSPFTSSGSCSWTK